MGSSLMKMIHGYTRITLKDNINFLVVESTPFGTVLNKTNSVTPQATPTTPCALPTITWYGLTYQRHTPATTLNWNQATSHSLGRANFATNPTRLPFWCYFGWEENERWCVQPSEHLRWPPHQHAMAGGSCKFKEDEGHPAFPFSGRPSSSPLQFRPTA